MELHLPQWVRDELSKNTEYSLQYIIRLIIDDAIENQHKEDNVFDRTKLIEQQRNEKERAVRKYNRSRFRKEELE